MKADRIRKFLPPGHLLSLTLIGLLLLSGILYYRAIKIQRFLEPALAISQPRMQFTDNLSRHIEKEFGTKEIKGIRFTKDFILVEPSLLTGMKGQDNTGKLGRVFLSILKDHNMKDYIDSIIVSTQIPLSPDAKADKKRLFEIKHISEKTLASLYMAEPELGVNFNTYFAATSMYVAPMSAEANMVKFKIVPSEQLHIDVLMRFEKYVH